MLTWKRSSRTSLSSKGRTNSSFLPGLLKLHVNDLHRQHSHGHKYLMWPVHTKACSVAPCFSTLRSALKLLSHISALIAVIAAVEAWQCLRGTRSWTASCAAAAFQRKLYLRISSDFPFQIHWNLHITKTDIMKVNIKCFSPILVCSEYMFITNIGYKRGIFVPDPASLWRGSIVLVKCRNAFIRQLLNQLGWNFCV